MKVFPCSVWCRYGDNAAIAFIIDSDNLSHCLACTCMFASVSQIDSESVMTDIEFEDFRDKYNTFTLRFLLL